MRKPQIAEPTALDEFVSELKQTGTSRYTGVLFPVHTRLQPKLFGLIEALTQHVGTSRNKVVNQLLEVGVEATLSALPDDLVEQLSQHASGAVSEWITKNGGAYPESGVL